MNQHIAILDCLRAIAALSVVWFHFTNAQFTEILDAYQVTGKYGWLGVQVFFVVSGFIIPFSMQKGGYRLPMFFRFLAKRLIRLDPPYFASIAIVLLGFWASAGLNGKASTFRVDWQQVGAHVGYINAFLDLPWLQMTYWSLAIEFQYYILTGIGFPLLIYCGEYAEYLILAAFAILHSLSPNKAFFFHHAPVFLIGIAAFRYYSLKISFRELALLSGGATGLLLLSGQGAESLVALATSAAILFVNFKHVIFTFLGRISYSIYLLHVFVGNMVFALGIKYLHPIHTWKYALPWIALLITIAASFLLYKLIEVPSQSLSSRIKYRPS